MRCIGDALEMLQRCIEQSPELLELYTLQCKILKHAGDLAGAAAAADKARSMDLADRYTNFQNYGLGARVCVQGLGFPEP